jgi:hypothetical protein
MIVVRWQRSRIPDLRPSLRSKYRWFQVITRYSLGCRSYNVLFNEFSDANFLEDHMTHNRPPPESPGEAVRVKSTASS